MMDEPIKVGEGQCRAHNPNKEDYEIWKVSEGFYCATHHMIGGPYIATPIYPTREEAEAKYRRQALIVSNGDAEIVMALVRTNVITRWPCTFCGGETSKSYVLCEAQNEHGAVYRACELCLKHGIDASLREQIERLEQCTCGNVGRLRGLLGRVRAPSFAEWLAAEEAAEAEVEWWAAHPEEAAKEQALWLAARVAAGEPAFDDDF